MCIKEEEEERQIFLAQRDNKKKNREVTTLKPEAFLS